MANGTENGTTRGPANRIPGVITRISGELLRVEDGSAEIRVGGIVYELLVPAADEERWRGSIGESVEFHTLHFLEGQGQGSSYWPRLIGFRSPLERDFFELFTTVKGIGNRKALRALTMPFGMVAELIVRRDVAMLTTLPEIGRRTAESIVVELKGKAERFTVLGRGENASTLTMVASAQPSRRMAKVPTAASGMTPPPPEGDTGTPLTDAIEVLVQLGESRPTARQLVERALDRDPGIRSADALVAAALRAR